MSYYFIPMKNKILLKNSIALLLPLAMAAGALLGARNTKVQEVSAYTSESSLPTTIDLNDTSASNIRSYYSSLNSLSTSERQGTNLLKNLKTILKNGQKYYSYDSGNFVWQIYEIADRDWSKSPASAITYGTYNSSTNKITGYTYGSNNSPKNDPYVHSLYTNRSVTNEAKAWGDHTQTNWGINREHVWPKAEGFETSGDGGARGDPMHLMAANGYANNIHSNYYYGYVDTSKTYTNCGDKYSYTAGNLLGTSKTVGGSVSVFEPQDSDKGDIARAIFYMVARYNYYSGSDSDGISSNNPNLALTQSLSDWSKTSFSSTTSKKGYMGIMTDLLAWHHADPVDSYEIHRNNLLYTNYTNNRNPFIDFPEWADFIWGTATYNGTSYQSYSSTPTGYATPSSDTINGYNQASSTVSVTGVSLNKNSTTLVVGGTETLTATVSPSNATNKNVTWTSSNTSVATVSNGTITAKKAGSATITVKTQDGNKTATCSVTVNSNTVSVTSVSLDKNSLTLDIGDNETLIATISPSNATNQNVSWTSSNTGVATVSNGIVSAISAGTATISVKTQDGNKTATCLVTVQGAVEAAISETSGSGAATSGEISGWTAIGTGDAYKDGAVKLDSTNDYIYKLDIFSGDISANMVELSVSINAKINLSNGVTSVPSTNTYTVSALDSSNNTLDSLTKTGSDGFTTSYSTVVFDLNNNLSGCTGICFTYSKKTTSTGGNIGLLSISWTATFTTPPATSITATPTRTFYVGEMISFTDISVKDNNDYAVLSFSFLNDGYVFTYSDAPSNGSAASKTFTNAVAFGSLTCSLTVNVQRKAYSTPTTETLTYTGDEFDDAGIDTSYGTGQIAFINDVKFEVDGYIYYSRLSLSNGKENAPGKVQNITAYPTGITNVSVTGASPDVQLSINGSTWVDLSNATPNTVDYFYFKIFYKNTTQTSYVNINKFEVTVKEVETAHNVANYIMYADTNNQCTSKFNVAIGYFESMNKTERSTFMTSNDYVILTARERLEAWAAHLGKQITYSNNDYIVIDAQNYLLFDTISSIKENNTIFFVIIGLVTGVTSVGAFILIKRRKQESK